jgi:GDP-L-fucose synthase
MNRRSKVFVAGHQGMVGSAIMRKLIGKGYEDIITATHGELDLTNQSRVVKFFRATRPDVVVDCAAKVGGIHANNTYRADFIYNNLQIQNNLIHSSYEFEVEKLLFLGSSCIYPKFADQPIKEEYLLASPLESTNEPYSVSKIAGIKMCESYFKQYDCDFISVMPCNQYGPNDNFHPKNSHVLPALLRRFHEAKVNKEETVEVWGTGKAKREFLHVDDLASACVFLLEKINSSEIYKKNISHLNIGSGEEISIANLARLIAGVVGYKGDISFQLDKPDGTLRKLMDVSRIKKLGWEPKVSLRDGLTQTYRWYVENETEIRSF